MSMSTWSRAIVALGFLATTVGCSSTVSTAPAVQPGGQSAAAREAEERGSDLFPSESRIDELMAGSAVSSSTANPALNVVAQTVTWRLTGALPSSVDGSTRLPRTDDEQAFARLVQVAELSTALSCMAEQTAYYHASHGDQAPQALEAFMALRCGATDDRAWTMVEEGGGIWAGRGSAAAGSEFSRSLQRSLEQAGMRGSGVRAGYWSGTAGGRTWTVTAFSNAETRVDPLPMAVSGSEVRVSGNVPSRYRSVNAAITYGEFEARPCRRDDNVRLPQFAVVCPVNRGDAMAVVSVGGFERGELLGHSIAQVMVSPTGTAPAVFEISELERGELWAATTGYTNQRVQQFVNALRRRHGLAEVVYLPEQSTVADAMLPYMVDDAFVNAQGGDPTDIRNTATLAVMAGTRVPSEIVGMDFSIEYVWADGPVQGFFSSLQLDPQMRQSLLSPDADAFAVASRQIDGRSVIMVSAFHYYEAGNIAEEQQRFLDRINTARAANGNRPLEEPSPQILELMNAAGGSLAIGEYTVDEVLQIVANYASTILSADVRVSLQRAPDMDEIEIPEQLLRGRSRAAVNVSSHTEPGTNWRQYVVTFLTW
jgi:hypothetical protein